MNRRGFLKAILAAGTAPYIISSGVLMPVKKILLPENYMLTDLYLEIDGFYIGRRIISLETGENNIIIDHKNKIITIYNGTTIPSINNGFIII